MSHGRGGAGNMGTGSNDVETKDLQTPTLKGDHYTTGRGGQGNIVSNDNAANARLAQDVETPTRHEPHTGGTYHWGRGGEGNMVTLGADEQKKKERSVSRGEAGHEKPSLLEKGKHALGLGNHKKE
ncbi:hypothetical protein MBLNU13_g05974t2 [Cladosporium sp. NU13]